MKKNIKVILLLLLAASKLNAQDFHLSLFDAANQYLNPAMTGMYMGDKSDFKGYVNYRSQWMTPELKPYSTAYLAFDMPLVKWHKQFGVGGYLINNRSGLGYINSFNFILSGAYNITGISNGRHLLTTGLQMGILHRNINPDVYSYDVQYSESMNGFDPGISNEENLSRSSRTNFDANFGIFYKYTEMPRRAHPFGGISIYHVTRPNESFSTTKSKMPMRFNLYGGSDVQINEEVSLTPRLLYMYESRAHEFVVGMITGYKIKKTPYEALFQFDYRHKDAVIIGLGLKQYQHVFRLAYDINTSSLGPYLGGRGSWEFSIILSGKRERPLFTR